MTAARPRDQPVGASSPAAQRWRRHAHVRHFDEPVSVLNLIAAAVQVQQAADAVAGPPTGDILDGVAERLFKVAAERAQHRG